MPGVGEGTAPKFGANTAPPHLRTWDGDGTPVQALTVAPSGKWVAWTTRKTLFAWDVPGNRSAPPQDKPDQPTVALYFVIEPPFAPDELLYFGTSKGKGRTPDVSISKLLPLKNELIFSFRSRPNFGTTLGTQHITAHGKSGLMVMTLEAGLLAFGQTEDGKSFHILAQLGHVIPGTRRSAVHPDGKRVLSYGSEGTVCVWEPKTQRQKIISDLHSAPITDVAVSPDGTQAVTGCRDKKVRVWTIQTEK